MILPTSLSLINATFRGKDRGIAFAVWGSTIGGMAAVGPLLGGWLTTYFSWRWAFGINVPLGVIIVIGTLIYVTESREETITRVDVRGAILAIVTSTSLVFGLIEGRTYGWWSTDQAPTFFGWKWPYSLSPIPIAFAIAVIAGVLFVLWGLRRQREGKSTMLAFDLLKIRSFRNGNLAAMIVSLGEFGIILSLPLWLQNVLGYSAVQTGLVLLGLAIGSFVASGFAGVFSGRLNPVTVVRVGILGEIVGLVIVALVISTNTPWYAIEGGLFVYGFGVGLATAQLTGVVLEGCSRRQERVRLRDAEHVAPDRLRPGHRHPGHHPLHQPRQPARREACRPARPSSRKDLDRERGREQCRVCHHGTRA